jgi:hypothetical protein
MGQDVFSVCASNFIVCFTSGSTGFTTPTWNGYPAAVCSPQINIVDPQANTALQDGIIFKGATSDFSGIYTVSFSVREPDGGEGISIGYDGLEASYNSTSGYWEYPFDTTKLQDGNYVVFANATDNEGHEGMSSVVPFSIRNGANTPLEQIQAIIDFFDNGVASGNLSGIGKTEQAAAGKLKAFRNMLLQAQYLIENENAAGACGLLMEAYKKADGTSRPPDFIGGSAAPELAAKIAAIIEDLNCL